MPFDYDQYQQKVNTLSTEQLHKEWENYTRQIAGGATSTATSVLFSPLTAGVSLIGLGIAAPRIHNARKKREIIEAGLQARGDTHNTRKRDVAAPMAVAGVISGLTLGLAGPGAEMLGAEAGAKGMEYIVAHAALDGAGAVLEQKHDDHTKKKAEAKLQHQQPGFQKQYAMGQVTQPQTMGLQPMMAAPQNLVHLPGVYAPPGMVAMMVQPTNNTQQQQLQQFMAPGQNQSFAPLGTSTAVPQYQQVINQPGFIQQQTPSGQAAPPYQLTYQQPQPAIASYMGGSVVAAAAAYPSEKQGETYAVQAETQGYPPSNSEPLPLYSPSMPLASSSEKPPNQSVENPHIILNELPAESQMGKSSEGVTSTESAMDQEIAMLKARLLQMELEKRGLSFPPINIGKVAPEAPMSPQLTVGLGCSDHEASRAATPMPPSATPVQAALSSPPPAISGFAPSPMSTPPPMYDSSVQAGPASPHAQQMSPAPPSGPPPQHLQQMSPPPPPGPPPQVLHTPTPPPGPPPQNLQLHTPTPPPGPPPQVQQHHIPPPGPPPQNMQQHQMPASPPPGPPPQDLQQHQMVPPQNQPQAQYQFQQPSYTTVQPPKPDYQRNDSGYYSQPPSRNPSVTSIPQYTPAPTSQYAPTPVSQYAASPGLQSPISPQSTGASLYNPSQHRYSMSSQSVYTPASTPGSALYFPPPPGNTNLPAVHPVGKQDYFGQARISTPQPPIYQPQPQMGQPQQIQVQQMGQPQQPQQPQQMYSQPPQQQQVQGTQGWQWGAPQQQFVQQPVQTGYPVQQQQVWR
ncbi:hypothetical protein GLAREA_06444 [Glarea lozoyensis ATCC 20868]|uniref:Uncharacterized protein n=1 Tax=Glarea lozoyensis (strain ATCC 20868 / MF5171) TaxID=1116229 RepID=S3DMV5_GLAL2|nr:uncharacterized protein GLAREA_06444 [Glarea lozoyensis ATCC 20868]EPE33431.1 hypothetical protein GLAREA_06444 [Glarea lozoyensis ATCC 20868]